MSINIKILQGLFSDSLDAFSEGLKTNSSSLELALDYSLSSPGKRIRPTLVLGLVEGLGGQTEDGLGYALALEMIHCGSLVHDDLPILDDDDMRRGRPACHIEYGEAVALLAGDAFIPLANAQILTSLKEDNPLKLLQLVELLNYATYQVCRGQVRDIELQKGKVESTPDLVTIVHREKTAALFEAAFAGAGILASLSKEKVEQLRTLGTSFGLIFQLADDLADSKADGIEPDPGNLIFHIGPKAGVARLAKMKQEFLSEAKTLDSDGLQEFLSEVLGKF